MNEITIGLLIAGVIVLSLFLISAYLGKKETSSTMESHFIADGGVSPFVAMMSMGATLMSAFVLVGLSGFFYTHGIGSWVYVGWSNTAMFLLTILFGYRIWILSKKFGYVTPIQFVSDRYQSKGLGVLTALVSIFFLFPYMSTQLVGVAKLINVLSDGQIPYYMVVAIVAVFAYILTRMGGMRTVARTDAIQGVFMFSIGLIICLIILAKGFDFSLPTLIADVKEVEPGLLSIPGPKGFYTWGRLFSVTLAAFFMPISQIQISSRYLTLKDKKSFRTMMVGTAIIPIIAIPAAMIIGLGGRVDFPGLVSGDQVFMLMLTKYVPIPLIICAVIAVLAACLSTIDSMLLGVGSLIGADLFPNSTKDKQYKYSMIGMIIIMVGVTIFSFNPPDLIVLLALASYTGTLQLVPAIVGAYFWKRATKQGAFSSILVGVGSYLLLNYTSFKITFGKFDQSFWAFVFASITFVVVSLLTKPSDEVIKRFDETMGYVNAVYPTNKEGEKLLAEDGIN